MKLLELFFSLLFSSCIGVHGKEDHLNDAKQKKVEKGSNESSLSRDQYPISRRTAVLTYYPGVPSASRTFQLCEGDCDEDSNCAVGLACWKRNSVSDPAPPGCTGTTVSEYDYCYDPASLNPPTSTPSDEPSNAPSPQPSLGPFTWDIDLITPGYLENPPIQDGVYEFKSKYNISDRFYDIQILNDDCATPSNGLPLNTISDSKSDGMNELEASFLYNQSLIQNSNLWTANSTGGEVNFCVKLSLYSDSSSNGILFNFHETVYKIEVDLTTGFSTEIDIIRTVAGDGGVETINVDENITVYQCNDSYHEVTFPPALTQGDALQICVETEDDSNIRRRIQTQSRR